MNSDTFSLLCRASVFGAAAFSDWRNDRGLGLSISAGDGSVHKLDYGHKLREQRRHRWWPEELKREIVAASLEPGIQMRVEIEFKVHGIAIGLRPHALYNDNRTGVLTLTGVTAVRILNSYPGESNRGCRPHG